jgi:hypothetical protein
VWWALSRACHHHPYELAATAPELQHWIAIADELARRIEATAGPAS